MNDAMNENVFDNAENALRQSWEIHRQAFGPILEPAFVENQQVRITLVAALNHISRREIKRGMEILQSIKEQCVYDEDKAAWTFFVGVCFEMAGDREQMLRWYEDAEKFGHRFYLPYLKIAKAAHQMAQFNKAQKYYAIAISCLLEVGGTKQDEDILASAYTNLTSCLTMMHRYTEADQAWQKAQQFPLQPGAAASAAILYAAMGQEEMAKQYIEQLKRKAPMLVEHTGEMVRQILNGEHPHFYPVLIAEERMEMFWDWFCQNEKELYHGLEQGRTDLVIEMAKRLKEIFAFLDREPKISAEKVGGTMTVLLSDSYAKALHHGYRELVAACPKELFDRWSFIVIH